MSKDQKRDICFYIIKGMYQLFGLQIDVLYLHGLMMALIISVWRKRTISYPFWGYFISVIDVTYTFNMIGNPVTVLTGYKDILQNRKEYFTPFSFLSVIEINMYSMYSHYNEE